MSGVREMSGVGAMKKVPRANRLKNWLRRRQPVPSMLHSDSIMTASFPRICKTEWLFQHSLAIRQGAVKLYPAGRMMNKLHQNQLGPSISKPDLLSFSFWTLNFVHGCLGPRERSNLVSRNLRRVARLPRVLPGRGLRTPAVSMAFVEEFKNAGE